LIIIQLIPQRVLLFYDVVEGCSSYSALSGEAYEKAVLHVIIKNVSFQGARELRLACLKAIIAGQQAGRWEMTNHD
jgi:hypothetical protein